MKRTIAIIVILFASQLPAYAAVLACLDTPKCEMTPACHQHGAQLKSASCCKDLSVKASPYSAPPLRLNIAKQPAASGTEASSVHGAQSAMLVERRTAVNSPPILTLRI
jgi:hypothetical protein